MKFNLKRMREVPGQPLSFEWSEERDRLDYKGRALAFKRAVHLEGQAFYRGGIVYLEAQLTTEVEMECSRCLKPLSVPVELKESLEFHEEPPTGLRGAPLVGFSYAHGAEELELMPYIERLIAASLESKPLCRPDCAGLCPSCGRDLNEGPCGCEGQRAVDPRLEKLKELLA